MAPFCLSALTLVGLSTALLSLSLSALNLSVRLLTYTECLRVRNLAREIVALQKSLVPYKQVTPGSAKRQFIRSTYVQFRATLRNNPIGSRTGFTIALARLQRGVSPRFALWFSLMVRQGQTIFYLIDIPRACQESSLRGTMVGDVVDYNTITHHVLSIYLCNYLAMPRVPQASLRSTSGSPIPPW